MGVCGVFLGVRGVCVGGFVSCLLAVCGVFWGSVGFGSNPNEPANPTEKPHESPRALPEEILISRHDICGGVLELGCGVCDGGVIVAWGSARFMWGSGGCLRVFGI